jgi:rod shape-determining protein MreD
MKYMLFTVLLISVFLETTIVNFPLTLVLIVLISMTQGDRASVLAFIAGVIYDFFSQRPIGSTSLFFLAVCWVISKYQRKLYLSGFFVPLIFVAVITAIYQLVFIRHIHIFQIVICVIMSAICLLVINRYLPEIDATEKSYRMHK